ncbi:MAG: hypothetical protein RL210_548 [Pseudomonadota bacterium]|jgi:two-component system response regulator RstA
MAHVILPACTIANQPEPASMFPSIAFIEDDVDLAGLISEFLGQNGFKVFHHERGDTAQAFILERQPDLVLLDVMLPGKDGLTICRELRPLYHGPIVMLTSVASDMNHILGLELGANDYLLKTTPPSVLLAHIRAQLRQARAQQPTNPVLAASIDSLLVFGKLRIDQANRAVALDGQAISLSTSDFDMLWLLASHAGEILSRDDLLQNLRGVSYDGLDRSIDVAISRLRKKLGDDSAEPQKLKTVRNRGYLFVRNGWDG